MSELCSDINDIIIKSEATVKSKNIKTTIIMTMNINSTFKV